ncbi:MAG: DUF1015 domain-containing protein [Limisphaerales bacterium]|jgi:uncharacterized protein (DUF1015 family)|nr:DUF1015 family protein [Verrucomicrobiota bacterium]
MAIVRPFAAIRPRPEVAGQICELPYDVVSTDEARERAEGKEHSFYRISRAEINFPNGINPYSNEVYAKARDLFQEWVAEGWLRKDAEPCYYLYRQIMGSHTQTGLVATVSAQEYLDGTIKKHEFTRPDKEKDRINHIEALNAQTGPVFLTYHASRTLNTLFAAKTRETPVVDFTGIDGVRHEAWVISDKSILKSIEKEFGQMPCLYIADGHHRSAAAARIYQSRGGKNGSQYFLAVLFPHDQMQILPYNRALKDLNGLSESEFLKKLEAVFTIQEKPFDKPRRNKEVALFLGKRWYGLNFKTGLSNGNSLRDQLGVQILQDKVLAPILGIKDPRTSERISFIGGIRGTVELEQMVCSGEYACAFSMFPTQIEEVMDIADQNEVMPPKSTWFEPKLRDGMFIYRYDKN